MAENNHGHASFYEEGGKGIMSWVYTLDHKRIGLMYLVSVLLMFGLGGLMAKFQQAGLGDVIGSWVGSGQNHAISGDQLHQVLGSDAVSELAGKLGIDMGTATSQLTQILPELINHLTPGGQAPAGGLGSSGDLMGMLGGLLGKA